ncbi:hypothetical protein KQ303_10100, partial [Synechococcus sp. CS-1333]|uniref:hypothetical protein n=1 Tax=Synechococcus sp. CS-1333 TaxID=2848638 RepID=UPI00223C28B5
RIKLFIPTKFCVDRACHLMMMNREKQNTESHPKGWLFCWLRVGWMMDGWWGRFKTQAGHHLFMGFASSLPASAAATGLCEA